MSVEEEHDRVHLGAVEEFDEGDRVLVDVDGREVAVFRGVDGFHAVSNYCVHQGGPVCEGLLSGALDVDDDGELVYDHDQQVVSCPWHGWEFDVSSGVHLANPNYRLPTYEVVVEDSQVYLPK